MIEFEKSTLVFAGCSCAGFELGARDHLGHEYSYLSGYLRV